MGYEKDILYEEFLDVGTDIIGSKLQSIENEGDIIKIMLTNGVLLKTVGNDYYDNLQYYTKEFGKDKEITAVQVIRYNHVYPDWYVDEFKEFRINFGDEVIRIIYDVTRDVGETSISIRGGKVKIC